MLTVSPNPLILTREGLSPESDLDGYGTLSISGSGLPSGLLALRVVEDDGTMFHYVLGPSFSISVRIVSAGPGHVDVLDATPRKHKRQTPIESASFTAVVG